MSLPRRPRWLHPLIALSANVTATASTGRRPTADAADVGAHFARAPDWGLFGFQRGVIVGSRAWPLTLTLSR
jgi:hypothetical protein